jgi:DMSO/TMAO reductase YedYZ molybdopterin-dependent catalytic subunit
MNSPVSRGFYRRSRPAAGEAGKVPQGQHATGDLPVLSFDPTPHTPLQEWTFAIRHGVQPLMTWSWPEFAALPAETVTADIHCVTRWSKGRHRLDRRARQLPAGSGRARRSVRAGLQRRRLHY